jgi:hypothetical protein
MAALFSSFGMAYAFPATAGGFLDLTTPGNVTPLEAAAFVAKVGTTFGPAALASYADGTGSFSFSYMCISVSGCGPASYVVDSAGFASGNANVGVALVRTAVVPVPAGLPLLLTGLIGFAMFRRRQRRLG